MKRIIPALQIAFTYIGTIVGAGFATGQEIVHFFTRYGTVGLLTILVSASFFIWFGTKIMLLANDVKAKSYEDVNRLLFGERIGQWFSFLLLFELFSISIVMLAGAGTVFSEQLELPFLLGISFTVVLAYLIMMRGMDGIVAVNTVVVPLMLAFTIGVFLKTAQTEAFLSWEWLQLPDPYLPGRAWIAPILYAAFNLVSAQAVLVPLGAAVKDRRAIRLGGLLGGLGLGLMLLIGHISLSVYAPAIFQYEIPMATVVYGLGAAVHFLFLLLIYAEVFTTLIANVFGLSLQMEHRLKTKRTAILAAVLFLCFCFSFIGFKKLLSFLYPLFGFLSLAWFAMMFVRTRRSA